MTSSGQLELALVFVGTRGTLHKGFSFFKFSLSLGINSNGVFITIEA